jgi:hypothetical protein
MLSDSGIRTDELLWLLGSLCRIGRVPFDPALLSRQFPPPHSAVIFPEAARALGFKTGERQAAGTDLAQLPLPCVAFLKRPGASPPGDKPPPLHLVDSAHPEAEAAPEPLHPALLLKTDGKQLLYFRTGSEQPETIAVEEFDTRFEPTLILLARDASLAPAGREAGGEGEENAPPKFGFRWFIPELLKNFTDNRFGIRLADGDWAPLPPIQAAVIGDAPGGWPEDVYDLAGTPVFDGYWIATLSGSDVAIGSNAADLLEGGTQSDLLLGSNGNDLIYGEDRLQDALQQVAYWVPSGVRGDWESGGLGDDLVVGSNGNDVLFGGKVSSRRPARMATAIVTRKSSTSVLI